MLYGSHLMKNRFYNEAGISKFNRFIAAIHSFSCLSLHETSVNT